MKKVILSVLFSLAFLFASGSVQAQTVKRVQFAKGARSVKINGTVSGYKYVDYIIRAKARQVLFLELSPSGKAEMVIFEPSGDNMPDAAGISAITTQTDATGDYKVRVLMPRAYARRNTISKFTLSVKIEDMQE